MVWLPVLACEFCRLGWRHWPVSDPGQCIWFWLPLQIDLGPSSSSRTWLVIWIQSFSAYLILVLQDPCQWDLCLVIMLSFWLPCPCRAASSSCSLIWSYWQFPATDVNRIWRKESNAKYNKSLSTIYLDWTQSPWQPDTEEGLIYKQYLFIYIWGIFAGTPELSPSTAL